MLNAQILCYIGTQTPQYQPEKTWVLKMTFFITLYSYIFKNLGPDASVGKKFFFRATVYVKEIH